MDKHAQLAGIVDRFETAMLTTVSAAGQLHGRPMAIAGRDRPLSTIYFVTDRESPKVEEISADSTGLVSMQHAATYVALAGSLVAETARLSEIEAMWQPQWQVWFSNDPGKGGIALLRFRIRQAEFWDRGGTNRWRILWQTRLAGIRNETLDDQELPGHAKVRMTPAQESR